jgi:hypothetical protein
MRSRDKQFSVGDQVLSLMPDSTASKTFSRWKGPAIIVEKRSPYSYLVELNGARHHIHANHLRKFYAQIGEIVWEPDVSSLIVDKDVNINATSCAIVYECDADFGPLHVVNSYVDDLNCVLLPSQKIDLATPSHLPDSQCCELFSVLDRYSACFSEVPRF